MPENFNAALVRDFGTPEKPEYLQKEVDLQTKGAINQLLLLQTNKKFEKKHDVQNTPGQFVYGDTFVQVLELVNDGYLLRERQIHLEKPPHTVNNLVL